MKYPNALKKVQKKQINYAHRGMNLEEDINETNQFYLINNIAVIHKKPTPILATKVSYPARNEAKITEGFFTTPSTTDYNGLYKGKYIDFETKVTQSKTSFSLKNIHNHQIEHLKKIIEHGGIGFLIVRFDRLDKTFLLKGETLIDFLNKETRKSIPYHLFETDGFEIQCKYNPRLDYLRIVDKVYLEEI